MKYLIFGSSILLATTVFASDISSIKGRYQFKIKGPGLCVIGQFKEMIKEHFTIEE